MSSKTISYALHSYSIAIMTPIVLVTGATGRQGSATAFYYPELASRHTFLTAYDPNSAMVVVDPGDVGKFAAAMVADRG